MIKVITHSGSFHADDVFAVALIKLCHENEEIEVIRTRDESLIATGDWVVDVGGMYEPGARRFDHHQNGVPVRENTIPYAAFGLVWKELGERMCGSTEIADALEEKLVLAIDANDVGVTLCESRFEEVTSFDVPSIIASYNPKWGGEEFFDVQFQKALEFATNLLMRLIEREQAKGAMKELIESVYTKADNKKVLEFETYVSVGALVDYPEVQLVVMPDNSGDGQRWSATAVRKNHNSFEPRVVFPSDWASFDGNELVAISGIEDAIFCHKNRYFFVAKSKESVMRAIAMVEENV